jgi:hypothetical protein
MKERHTVGCCLRATIVWLAGCLAWSFITSSHAADANPTDVLGRAGELQLTVQEVQAALASLSPDERTKVTQDPALLDQAVRSWLAQKVVLKEAHDKKWDESPAIQERLERAKNALLAESYLQSMAQPPEGFPSEEELRAGYDAARPALLVPRSYLLAQIFIAEPRTNDDAAEQKTHTKIERVRKALRSAGSDFAQLARDHSEEPQSASRGGEIGWLTETQIQPEIRAQLPKLKLNLVSEPLHLNDGWHILKVLDVRESYTPTLEQVRVQLQEQMRAERTRLNTQAFLENLLRAHPLEIHSHVLSKALQTTTAK